MFGGDTFRSLLNTRMSFRNRFIQQRHVHTRQSRQAGTGHAESHAMLGFQTCVGAGASWRNGYVAAHIGSLVRSIGRSREPSISGITQSLAFSRNRQRIRVEVAPVFRAKPSSRTARQTLPRRHFRRTQNAHPAIRPGRSLPPSPSHSDPVFARLHR